MSLARKTGPALRVLVVDDDPNELKSLVIGLRMEGIDAEGTSSGSTALGMLEEKSYSFAIIDLMMPEMNGLQLARAVRSAYPGVMTMLMSAYHLSPVQIERADTGVVGFVPKPFRFDDLVRFILSKVGSTALIKAPLPKTDEAAGLFVPIDIPATGRALDSRLAVQANSAALPLK